MAQSVAHLVDHAIPHARGHQWVLSLTHPPRLLLAAQPKLVTPAPRPHLHLRRFLGLLAPNAKLRACGGELKILAAILAQSVIEQILTHLRLQARAHPRAPARGRAREAEQDLAS